MRTVYIVNKGAHDHSDAERFGRLVYLSDGEINKYSTNKMYRTFADKLRRSQPDDLILITGLTVMSCIACSCFSFLHRRLNVLLYKMGGTHNGRYIERRLQLSNLLTYGPEAQSKQIDELVKEE